VKLTLAEPTPPVEEPLVLPAPKPTPPVEEPVVLLAPEPAPHVEEPVVLPAPEPAPPVEEPVVLTITEPAPIVEEPVVLPAPEPAPIVEEPVVLPAPEPAPPFEEPTASVDEATLPVSANPPGDDGLPDRPSEEPATPYALTPKVDEGVELDAFDDDDPTVMRPGDSLSAPPPPEPRSQPEVVAPVEEPVPTQPAAAVAARPQPVAAPPPAPSSGGGSFLPSVFVLACAAAGSLLGFALFLGPSRALLAQPLSPSPMATPYEAPVESAIAPDAPVELEAPIEPIEPTVSADAAPEGVAEFVVLSDELRKLQVRCADASAAGTSPLQVSLEATSACTITAIYNDRSRATAVLDAAAPGQRYDCFSDGANLCQAH